MKKCEKCKTPLNQHDGWKVHLKIMCDNCYMDELMPKRPKSHYDNDAEFMQRLKDSYPVRKQQYH